MREEQARLRSKWQPTYALLRKELDVLAGHLRLRPIRYRCRMRRYRPSRTRPHPLIRSPPST
ncbi:hypothetical protein WKI71_05700 [Streptomyces sp. MS1.AVA.1]|uniref:Transposase n=1 Tax=Streptomyces machairae TaxID=3134109 RepID=A0ABU8UH42_9ACTN